MEVIRAHTSLELELLTCMPSFITGCQSLGNIHNLDSAREWCSAREDTQLHVRGAWMSWYHQIYHNDVALTSLRNLGKYAQRGALETSMLSTGFAYLSFVLDAIFIAARVGLVAGAGHWQASYTSRDNPYGAGHVAAFLATAVAVAVTAWPLVLLLRSLRRSPPRSATSTTSSAPTREPLSRLGPGLRHLRSGTCRAFRQYSLVIIIVAAYIATSEAMDGAAGGASGINAASSGNLPRGAAAAAGAMVAAMAAVERARASAGATAVKKARVESISRVNFVENLSFASENGKVDYTTMPWRDCKDGRSASGTKEVFMEFSVLPSFVDGERERNGVSFHRVTVNLLPTAAGSGVKREVDLDSASSYARWDDVDYAELRCENHDDGEKKVDARKTDKDIKLAPLGCKCPARFTVSRTTVLLEPDGRSREVARVRYLCSEHNSTCAQRASSGCRSRSDRAKRWLRQLVQNNMHATISWLAVEYPKPWITSFIAQHPELQLKDDASVRQYWIRNPGSMPTDANISHDDISVMRQRIIRETFRFDPDDAASVEEWTKANPDLVIYYQRQGQSGA